MTLTITAEEAERSRQYAAGKLARLQAPHPISRFQAGDEDAICGDCLVRVITTPRGWQHDPDAIRELRQRATEGQWPQRG